MSTSARQWGVVREPDLRVERIRETREEIEAEIAWLEEWKVEREQTALACKAALDRGDLPPTNEPWVAWDHGVFGNPAIKDMSWRIVTRLVTAWEPA